MTLLLIPGAGIAFNHCQNAYAVWMELLYLEKTENSQVQQQMPVNKELALGSNFAILLVPVPSPEHEEKRPHPSTCGAKYGSVSIVLTDESHISYLLFTNVFCSMMID